MTKAFTYIGIGTVVYLGIPYAMIIHTEFNNLLRAWPF